MGGRGQVAAQGIGLLARILFDRVGAGAEGRRRDEAREILNELLAAKGMDVEPVAQPQRNPFQSIIHHIDPARLGEVMVGQEKDRTPATSAAIASSELLGLGLPDREIAGYLDELANIRGRDTISSLRGPVANSLGIEPDAVPGMDMDQFELLQKIAPSPTRYNIRTVYNPDGTTSLKAVDPADPLSGALDVPNTTGVGRPQQEIGFSVTPSGQMETIIGPNVAGKAAANAVAREEVERQTDVRRKREPMDRILYSLDQIDKNATNDMPKGKLGALVRASESGVNQISDLAKQAGIPIPSFEEIKSGQLFQNLSRSAGMGAAEEFAFYNLATGMAMMNLPAGDSRVTAADYNTALQSASGLLSGSTIQTKSTVRAIAKEMRRRYNALAGEAKLDPYETPDEYKHLTEDVPQEPIRAVPGTPGGPASKVYRFDNAGNYWYGTDAQGRRFKVRLEGGKFIPEGQ